MKTVKFLLTAFLLAFCINSFSQTSSEKKNVYLVQAAHTPEQCVNALKGIKDKGDNFLSKFEFGCMSGDHTGYAFLEAKSDAEVRQMLPKEAMSSVKIQKVDKFTGDQIDKIHKEKSSGATK